MRRTTALLCLIALNYELELFVFWIVLANTVEAT